MPLYEYECVIHGVFQDYVDLSAYKTPQPCPVDGCHRRGTRIISKLQRPIIHEKGGPRERSRRIKEKGLIELGNEPPESVTKYFNDKRAEVEAQKEEEMNSAASELMQELGSDVADAIVKECVGE